MAYTLISPSTIPLQPHEFQVLLDTGQTVALRGMVKRLGNGSSSFEADARVVNTNGETVEDANGVPITAACRFTLDAAVVASATPAAASKDAALLALGEAPLALTTFSAGQLASWSIRSAILAAAHAGHVTTLGSML